MYGNLSFPFGYYLKLWPTEYSPVFIDYPSNWLRSLSLYIIKHAQLGNSQKPSDYAQDSVLQSPHGSSMMLEYYVLCLAIYFLL